MFRIKLFLYDLFYVCYDKRMIKGVWVKSYWRLKSVKVYRDHILIPLSKRRGHIEDQVILLLEYFRKAVSYRIQREKGYGKTKNTN